MLGCGYFFVFLYFLSEGMCFFQFFFFFFFGLCREIFLLPRNKKSLNSCRNSYYRSVGITSVGTYRVSRSLLRTLHDLNTGLKATIISAQPHPPSVWNYGNEASDKEGGRWYANGTFFGQCHLFVSCFDSSFWFNPKCNIANAANIAILTKVTSAKKGKRLANKSKIITHLIAPYFVSLALISWKCAYCTKNKSSRSTKHNWDDKARRLRT